MTNDIQDSKSELKLYAPNEAIAEEMRKLYPGVEVVLTPREYPTMPDDKELSEIINCIFCDGTEKVYNIRTDKYEVCLCAEMKQALLAWRERAVLRGKMEVLKQLKSSPLGLVGEAVRSIDSVIASLEAELKKLEEK